MDEASKQRLRQLLGDAISYLQIEVLETGVPVESMGSLDYYIPWLKNVWISRGEDRWSRYNFQINIKNEATKAQLLDFIKDEFAQFICADKIGTAFSMKGGALDPEEGCLLEDLLWQLLRIAIIHGLDKAVSDFDRYATKNQAHVEEIAILQGIRLEQQIQITDGVQLIPLPDSVSDLPDYLPEAVMNHAFFNKSADSLCSKTLLIVSCLFSPRILSSKQTAA